MYVRTRNIILILAFTGLIFYSNAYAVKQSTISITEPTSNGIITASQVQIAGSFSSPDVSPTVSFKVDGGAVVYPYAKQPDWYTTVYLGQGWHTITSYLSDSNGVQTASERFLITNGNIQTTKYKLIVPLYSEACQKMINIHDYSSCPPLSELVKFDTSNQNISGKFLLQKDGTIIRTPPQIRNHYVFYTDKIKVCVGCQIDLGNPDIVQLMFIEPRGFSYTIHDFTTTVEQNSNINSTVNVNSIAASMLIHYDVFVDTSCLTANLDYTPFLMNDTINYMESGCKIAHYNKTTTTLSPHHVIDYGNIPQYKYMGYVKASLKANTGNCITQKCITVPNPQNKFDASWSAKIK